MVTKMSGKGQIVIPVELRRKYNINPGTEIKLMDIGGEIVIIPIILKNPIDEASGLLKGGKTTRELLSAARSEEKRLEKNKK